MRKTLRKISVIGHFGFGLNAADGQTIKTKVFTNALSERFGAGEVLKYDTHGSVKSMLKMPFLTFKVLRGSENVIIFPAHRGVRVIVPLLTLFNGIFHRRLHYCVIGGWLPSLLERHRSLQKKLKKFCGIYVETSTMKAALERAGFENIYLTPNCKELSIVGRDEWSVPLAEPYRLCTFSRVMKEKGIGNAAKAVAAVNEQKGKTVFMLDIYGQVDPGQTEWFRELSDSFPDTIRYGGVVPYEESVDTLKQYFALLFPTRFYTEGVPGTIIDAYAAGVPVIASKWESFSDIVRDGVTGIGYRFDSDDDLLRVLSDICGDPEKIYGMKANCSAEAKKYLPQNALKELINQIGA